VVGESWPAIEDHPPGLDRAYWRSVMSRANIAITAIVGVTCGILLATPAVRSYLHVASTAPAWLAATWPITVALVRRVGLERLPPPAPWLAMFFVHGIATGSSIGAASEVPFSAGWALLLVFPASWAFTFPQNRMLLATFMIVPPCARLVLAPHPTPSSLLYAAALGLLAAASLIVLSRQRIRLRAREDALLVGQTFGAPAADGAASLVTAMRVHDGLSGALMLAQTRAATSSDAETVAAAQAFGRKAKIILVGFTSGRSRDLEWLDELGNDFGLELELALRGHRIKHLSVDIHDVLVELLANQARHGEPGPVRLTVDARRSGTRIELQAVASRAPNGDGRGTRNLARRIAATGGMLRTSLRDGTAVISIDMRDGLGSRAWGTFVHATPPIVAYAWSGDGVVTIAMGVLSLVLIAVANASNRHVARDHAHKHRTMRAEIDRAAGPTLDQVRSELTTALASLDRALDAGDAPAIRDQLAQISTWMTTRLRALETPVSRADRAEAPQAPPVGGSSR
jgi:hypothetical protein